MKKKTGSVRSHARGTEFIAAVGLAVVAICTLAGSDAFINSPDSPRIAHANTSANPYQPVDTRTPIPFTTTRGDMRSSAAFSEPSTVSDARFVSIERRLAAFRRSAASIAKQIYRAEDSIDALQKKMDASPGRKNDALDEMILKLTDHLARLDKRLAVINDRIARYEIMLDPSKDQSR